MENNRLQFIVVQATRPSDGKINIVLKNFELKCYCDQIKHYLCFTIFRMFDS